MCYYSLPLVQCSCRYCSHIINHPRFIIITTVVISWSKKQGNTDVTLCLFFISSAEKVIKLNIIRFLCRFHNHLLPALSVRPHVCLTFTSLAASSRLFHHQSTVLRDQRTLLLFTVCLPVLQQREGGRINNKLFYSIFS